MALASNLRAIEVGSAAFAFERRSGALVGVRNRVTGNECLQARRTAGTRSPCTTTSAASSR